MKLVSWIIAGVSAVAATAYGVFSLAGGGGNNTVLDSSSAESATQPSSVNRGIQPSDRNNGGRTPLTTKEKDKALREGVEKYKKCRTYSINCKSLLPISKDSALYNFLD